MCFVLLSCLSECEYSVCIRNFISILPVLASLYTSALLTKNVPGILIWLIGFVAKTFLDDHYVYWNAVVLLLCHLLLWLRFQVQNILFWRTVSSKSVRFNQFLSIFPRFLDYIIAWLYRYSKAPAFLRNIGVPSSSFRWSILLNGVIQLGYQQNLTTSERRRRCPFDTQ